MESWARQLSLTFAWIAVICGGITIVHTSYLGEDLTEGVLIMAAGVACILWNSHESNEKEKSDD